MDGLFYGDIDFKKLSALESFSLRIAGPIFKIYPYKTLIDQSLAVTAASKQSQEFLRPAMASLSKDEFVQIMMATSACLHYEPDCRFVVIPGAKHAANLDNPPFFHQTLLDLLTLFA